MLRHRTRSTPLLIIVGLGLLAGCSGSGSSAATTPAPATSSTTSVAAPTPSRTNSAAPASSTAGAAGGSADPAMAAAVLDVVRQQMVDGHLKSAIVRVTMDGKEIVTDALGETMTGVPASTDMHFRNGAVAISYVATLLLQLVDDGTVSLDDPLGTWLPDFPNADQVTLGQLAQMTSGIPDYVQQPPFLEALVVDPFRQWTPEELLAQVSDLPLIYPPGTNWNYSHSNYVLLGLALEKITGRPVDELLQDKVLGPLGLTNTVDPGSPEITEPVLHAFSSERRAYFNVPADQEFYEESTFWDPSWTITRGAIQTTNIYDLTATAVAVGEGTLLTPESHAAQVSTGLRGFGAPVEGCGTCFTQSEGYAYGIGVVTTGNWVLQNPMFSGFAAAEGYLASQKIAVAVAVTFEPGAFTADGAVTNEADLLFRKIGGVVAPDDAPPIKN